MADQVTKTLPIDDELTKRIAEFFDEAKRDVNIRKISRSIVPPTQNATALGAKITEGASTIFEEQFDDRSFIKPDELMMHFDLQAFKDVDNATAFAATDAANIARCFNLYTCALYINGKLIEDSKEAHYAADIHTHLYGNYNAIRSGCEYWKHFDEVSTTYTDTAATTVGSPPTTTKYFPVFDSAMTTDEKKIVFTKADGGQVIALTTDEAAAGAIVKNMTIAAYDLRGVLPSCKQARRNATIGLTNNKFSLSVPLSYWFDSLRNITIPIPIKSIRLEFLARDPRKFIVSADVTRGVKLHGINLEKKVIQLSAATYEAYKEFVQAKPVVAIPYFKWRHDTASVTGSASYTSPSKIIRAGAYLFNFFRTSDNTDEFAYVAPRKADTTQVSALRRATYDDEIRPFNENLTINQFFAPASGKVSVPYDDYKVCGRFLQYNYPSRAMLISPRDFLYRPIFCCKLNYSTSGFTGTTGDKVLREEWTFGEAPALANLEIHSLIAKETVLTMNLITGDTEVEINEGN